MPRHKKQQSSSDSDDFEFQDDYLSQNKGQHDEFFDDDEDDDLYENQQENDEVLDSGSSVSSEQDFDLSQSGSLDKHTLKEIIAKFKKSDEDKSKELLERYENSIVKIFTTHKTFDYEEPWMPPRQQRSSGSGFILNFNGEMCLVTNAHVSDTSALLQVRLADETTTYTAKVKVIDHDCDLALLSIDDKKFWKKVKPLELGEMPKLRSELQVFGFPMGGEELCITSGQVSRIEVDQYVNSGISLLQTQVSAAINPGNSGGPAIHNGKVLGVAFQGSSSGEGLGYIIPPPIIKHFLHDALTNKEYQGFPDLDFTHQTLEDKNLRNFLGMEPEQTGIRIKKIPQLSSTFGLLKTNDVLLALDGIELTNDGTVALDFNKRINFNHLANTKAIGESIQATILRDKEILNIDIPLCNRGNTTYYSTREYEKAPTYYIQCGMIMMPLTDNFIDDSTGFFSSADIELEKYQTKFKKVPGREIVFINQILGTEQTKDILDYKGSILKSVNGHKVKNLRDVIEAFESNTEKNHSVITKSDNIIIIKNLNATENKEILKEFNISKDRSDDLLTDPVFRPGCPESRLLTLAFDRVKRESAEPKDNPIIEEEKRTAHRY